MTRLLTCGWETGDVNELGAISTIGGNMALATVSSGPAPRAGVYCLRAASTTGTLLQSTTKTFVVGVAQTETWVRFAFQAHVSGAAEGIIARWQDASGAAQAILTYTVSDGLLRVYRGGTIGGGALLGTASTAFAVDTWHVVEWRMQILTATTGASEVWLDGNQVITFSGDTSGTTTLNMQTLDLGIMTTLSGQTAGNYVAFDDLAVNNVSGSLNNGRPGDGRILLLSPTGAGTTTQLARGGTDTGANWSQVSELPPSILQYVSSPTVGQRDLYTLADLAVAVASINVVEAVAYAQNSDAGGGYIAPTLKSGATTNEAGPIGLATTPGYVTSRWETDPNTAAAWTQAAVNALEAGATIR